MIKLFQHLQSTFNKSNNIKLLILLVICLLMLPIDMNAQKRKKKKSKPSIELRDSLFHGLKWRNSRPKQSKHGRRVVVRLKARWRRLQAANDGPRQLRQYPHVVVATHHEPQLGKITRHSKRICPQSVESAVSGSRGGFEGVGMSPAHHDRTTYDL